MTIREQAKIAESNEMCAKQVKRRVPGVIFDRRTAPRVKEKVVRPLMYDLKMMALRKIQEAGMKMLRFLL